MGAVPGGRNSAYIYETHTDQECMQTLPRAIIPLDTEHYAHTRWNACIRSMNEGRRKLEASAACIASKWKRPQS